ncbi:MAG: lyase family protein [Desulfurococcaceae archaeon]
MSEVLAAMRKYKFFVGGESKEVTDRYVSSLDFDKVLAKYVAMVMLAHVKELAKKGVVGVEPAKRVAKELVDIARSNGEKLYSWVKSKGEMYEDVFEALEAYLHDAVGPEAGRIAIGRSRNDHVAAALRLALRDKLLEILVKLLELRGILVGKALEYRGVLFPFFTHGQVAQCGNASIYFLSYEKAFADICALMTQGLNLLNQNPLGSGAAAGTIVKLNTGELSKNLCFSPEPLPPYYATGSRLFLLYMASLLAMVMAEVGRFAEDSMLLTTTIQRGVRIPRNHISTSSIMPHKRNLVTLEIARAKASKVIGVLTSLLAAYKSVPYGYNLDFQEMNIYFFEALNDVTNTLDVVKDFVGGLELDGEGIKASLIDKPCWSSDLIEYIAIDTGIPVRELYMELARVLQVSMTEHAEQLEEFLAKYGVDWVNAWMLYKLKPVEEVLGEMIDSAERRLQDDLEMVKHLSSNLSQCSRVLVEGASDF